ncbi:MAG: threonine synthase [Terriglobales bacterium]
MHLRCIQCAATCDLHQRVLACTRCGDLLEAVAEVRQPPDKLKRLWRERRMSNDARDLSGVWRFREFLPDGYDRVITMAEGNTPLLRAQRSADWGGLRNLRFKHLGWNPTLSFKDLGMTVGVTEAVRQGAKAVACASTGNTAASMAAYAARAGITARVYLPAGHVSLAKVAQSIDYGAELVQIEGNFDQALDAMLAAGGDIYFLNSINPFRIEGQKTVVYEMMEQLDWQPPDVLICPGGNLGNSSAFGKALEELKAHGLIEKVPRLIVVQAEGANPLAQMWRSGATELTPVQNPETVATAIRIGNPRSWKKVLRALRFTDGMVLDVSDDEIGEAKEMIGRDGIGCEPASATTLAGLRKLVAQRQLDPDASVVAILTGHVLKDPDFIIKRHQRAVAAEAEVHAS